MRKIDALPKYPAASLDVENILAVAESFDKSRWILFKTYSEIGDDGLFVAIICNSAFAIELYMKLIYVIENAKLPTNTHNLKQLFGVLSVASQQEIKTRFEASVDTDETIKYIKENHPERAPAYDFSQVVEDLSDAFVAYRYSFEPNSKKPIKNAVATGNLIISLRSYIKQLRPDLQSVVPWS